MRILAACFLLSLAHTASSGLDDIDKSTFQTLKKLVDKTPGRGEAQNIEGCTVLKGFTLEFPKNTLITCEERLLLANCTLVFHEGSKLKCTKNCLLWRVKAKQLTISANGFLAFKGMFEGGYLVSGGVTNCGNLSAFKQEVQKYPLFEKALDTAIPNWREDETSDAQVFRS